ncbi:hypothetical protein SAMN05216333_10572 [Nitrosomonas oligotropha]|uniref:Uncharacterized protein n=1 Tax=Nitrosomonas oligotropha TaxID=42354 RepID=A0A1H8MF77_9PROT|nr:hypothetical protein SAMN05216300_10578 [Nitrosomonas oligotropha]SEO15979.1 hypothetical protein SAMN05216333_10572 [Nitrosomonas oligotropha]
MIPIKKQSVPQKFYLFGGDWSFILVLVLHELFITVCYFLFYKIN